MPRSHRNELPWCDNPSRVARSVTPYLLALMLLLLWSMPSNARSVFREQFLKRFAQPVITDEPFRIDGLETDGKTTYVDPVSRFETSIKEKNGTRAAIAFFILNLSDDADQYTVRWPWLRTKADVDEIIKDFETWGDVAGAMTMVPQCLPKGQDNDATTVIFEQAYGRSKNSDRERALVYLTVHYVLKSYLDPTQGGSYLITAFSASGPDLICP